MAFFRRFMNSAAADNLPVAFCLMMAGVVLMAGMDTVAKILTVTLPLSQVVWGRFFFHTMLMTPLALHLLRRRSSPSPGSEIAGHVARGILIVLSTVFYFAAIRDNPIPDAIAVFFIEPIFVMFLAAAFLGEKLRRRRLLAGLLAFVGVLVVLRPGGGVYSPSIFLALLAGLSFAGYIIATRVSSVRGSPLFTAWATAAAALVFCAPLAWWNWQPPDLREWLLMLLMGALAAAGHLSLTYACRLASASLVGMFHYSEIIAATAISYAVFGHVPDIWVWVGFVLIAGAKIGVIVLEMRERQRR